MRIFFPKSTFVFTIMILTVVTYTGCGLSGLAQNRKSVTTTKTQESVFIVVDTTDAKNPTVAGSIPLPFRVGPNNNVVFSGKYAYVTTAQHLHIIELSDPQHPAYMTSLAFSDDIGKARVSGHQVYVESRYRVYVVDVSNPTRPAFQSTVRLNHTNKIKDFDVHESYLYVMDTDDHLHIFDLAGENPQFVDAVALPQFWFLGLIPKGSTVKPIQRAKSWQVLLAYQNGNFLELCGGRYGKIRFSKDYLVFANYSGANPDITIVWPRSNYVRRGGMLEHYDVTGNCLAYLYMVNLGKRTDVYAADAGNVLLVAQDQWSHKISAEDKVGALTDFQISGDRLYALNAKGFFSIIDLVESHTDRFLAVTTLGTFHPMSIAVSGNYAGVLCDLE
ncbi:hypothetical protein F4Z99_08515 [Candidatus Poribacteria bacterium]|nr:hypothetical protein [Candidatus Poribacteria bacterium]MYB01003.1 hypothetical protein [Candidatus Poribacteria bacterium]